MDYRFKAEIELDEEKILQDGKYDLSEIYAVIREWFNGVNLHEVTGNGNTLVFIGTEEENFIDMGMLLIFLYEAEWFQPYVTKLLWYNRDLGEGYVEDVIKKMEEYTLKYGE